MNVSDATVTAVVAVVVNLVVDKSCKEMVAETEKLWTADGVEDWYACNWSSTTAPANRRWLADHVH